MICSGSAVTVRIRNNFVHKWHETRYWKTLCLNLQSGYCNGRLYGEIYCLSSLCHWLGAYRTNALYSGPIFVRFNALEDVFT